MTNFLVLKDISLSYPRSGADDAVYDLHVVADRHVVEHDRVLYRNIWANLAVAANTTVLDGGSKIRKYAVLVQHTVHNLLP